VDTFEKKKKKIYIIVAIMSFKTQLFIDGKWADPVLKGTFATFQPTTGEVLAHVSNATAEDVEIAVASAKACLYGPNWGN
jgi:acyl-CoA reductase-like NAD-dependent aldehyde dehydrogenase